LVSCLIFNYERVVCLV